MTDLIFLRVCKMGKSHDKKVKLYGKPENLDFLEEQITEVITERKLRDVFTKCYSELTPDLLAFTENDDQVYVGEIKGFQCTKNIEKARRQINKYMHELDRYGIPNSGFIIVGDFIEIYKSENDHQPITI
jgi:hypothetical protein